jgi:hypothetical protein
MVAKRHRGRWPMLKFLTTKIQVFLVLHWVDWRVQGNNFDRYLLSPGREDTTNPALSFRRRHEYARFNLPVPDTTPYSLWPSSLGNSCLKTDLNAIDTFPCKDSSQDSQIPGETPR